MSCTLMLRPQDRQCLLALLRTHLPDVKARAYGSRVTGKAHEASDLDLALMRSDSQPIDFTAMEDFRQALTDSNIPILVDARDWARLPKSFHAEIEKSFVDI